MKIAVIHVNPVSDLPALSPIRKCLLMLFLLAIKDRATRISHEYGPELSRLRYQIDGSWCDLVPLPESMGPLVGQEARSWIHPSPLNRALADQLRRWASRFDPCHDSIIHYPFLLIVDPLWSIWEMTIQTENGRGRVDFDLLDRTDWSSQQVAGVLKLLSSEAREFSEEDLTKHYPSLY